MKPPAKGTQEIPDPPNVAGGVKLVGDIVAIEIALGMTETGQPFVNIAGAKTDGVSKSILQPWECRVLALRAVELALQTEGNASSPTKLIRVATA